MEADYSLKYPCFIPVLSPSLTLGEDRGKIGESVRKVFSHKKLITHLTKEN